MRTLKIFNASNKEVRAYITEEKIWFHANDICQILDIDVLAGLESLNLEDKKFYADKVWIVSQKGFFNLLFQSENNDAKDFQKWLRDELGSEIDITMKTLLPNHLVFYPDDTDKGRFELRQKLNPKGHFKSYKFFSIIPGNEIPKAGKVGTIQIDGKSWFGAKDVCTLLGLLGHTLQELILEEEICEADKHIVINETGLYYLLFSSMKIEARSFVKIAKQKFFPIQETSMFEKHKTNSKVFRNWVKIELPKYIRILENGIIGYTENSREKHLPYKLFPTYLLNQSN